MLKRAIAITGIAIVIIFGIITAVLIFKPQETSGRLTVHYNNGLANNAERDITRNVPTYASEGTDIKETRANKTKLISIKSAGFERPGYTFDGWKLGFDGVLIDDEYVPGGLSKNDGIITFVATWLANQYVISFNPEYPGVTAPANIEVTTGEPMNGLYPAPFIIGSYQVGDLVFMGWRTQKNGKGKLIENGMVCTFTDHTMLYGWWINPNDSVHQRTLTIMSAVVGGGQGPFATEYKTYTYGTVLDFCLVVNDGLQDFDEYSGYKFSHFMIGSQTYQNFGNVFTYTLNSNTTIIAYYTVTGNSGGNHGGGNQNNTHTLTISSAMVNGGTGPFKTEHMTFAHGTELEFYLRLNDGIQDFDEYAGYTFAYFKIGSTIYYPSSFAQNGNLFLYVLNANTTVTAYYY